MEAVGMLVYKSYCVCDTCDSGFRFLYERKSQIGQTDHKPVSP